MTQTLLCNVGKEWQTFLFLLITNFQKTNHMSTSEIFNAKETQSNENTSQQNLTASSLKELIMGFRTTQLISVAAKLNLADYLRESPRTTEQLSEILHTNAQELYRLLRALSSLGIFQEKNDGIFSTTPLAELLCDNTPGSLRSLAVLYGEDWLWQAYAQLLYSVKNGKQAFDYVHGQTFYDYLQQHPEAAANFHNAMTGYSGSEAAAVINAYDFYNASVVIDIGGSQGTLISSLLRENPHLSGIVFDLPLVIEKAKPDLTSSAKDSKISYVGGNFFIDVPAGGDIYLLKSVLHNWDDASCIEILSNCRKAMKGSAKLLVIERVIPLGNERSEAKLFDINMLVVTGGQERTEEEYGNLLSAAGFTLARIISTQSSVSIIEGLPLS